MINCRICGDPATYIFRCEKHNRCDDCGTRERVCHYKEGVLCPSCHTKRVNDRIATFDGDTTYTSEITCPHCGREESDSWGISEGEREYGDCGLSYEIERIVTVEYSTSKVPSPAELVVESVAGTTINPPLYVIVGDVIYDWPDDSQPKE